MPFTRCRGCLKERETAAPKQRDPRHVIVARDRTPRTPVDDYGRRLRMTRGTPLFLPGNCQWTRNFRLRALVPLAVSSGSPQRRSAPVAGWAFSPTSPAIGRAAEAGSWKPKAAETARMAMLRPIPSRCAGTPAVWHYLALWALAGGGIRRRYRGCPGSDHRAGHYRRSGRRTGWRGPARDRSFAGVPAERNLTAGRRSP